MKIDEGAPWWVNLTLLLVGAFIVGAIVSVIMIFVIAITS